MNNENDIEVVKTHGGDKYRITIGDTAIITVNIDSKLFLHINRDYGELDNLEAAQLAGVLIAVETLTAMNEHQAMNALTVALETMNDVREKAGTAPLVDVDDVLDDRTDQEHVRDLIKKIRRGQA
ncbi:hypothetical protein [Brevibacterium paucivorans]|uniref:hypothetical protein n=1 Tax=Brevibacterium paucivorans TaxID=170994 RepID=UPI0032193BC7